ncbi:MAG TPA: phosphatase PAP2 family protein [Casimicrobiaceae bacterium]|nr:phosphatase PAP2 family protein [Casimicrobiaceae bacterium]
MPGPGTTHRKTVSPLAASLVGAAVALGAANASAGGGPFGIDHRIAYDDSGIWARHNQQALEIGVIGFELGGALWLGADDRLGRTLWQSIDASAAGGIASQVAKYAFGRERPGQTDSPNQWFKGRCCQSFPSGEVTLQASFVTPIIANYHADHPWVWALEALPLYDGIARMKTQSHWQSDVLAGWALGTAIGYYATTRDEPFFVSILPQGITAGIHATF